MNKASYEAERVKMIQTPARATVRLTEAGFRACITWPDGEITALTCEEYKDARDFITEKGIANKNVMVII